MVKPIVAKSALFDEEKIRNRIKRLDKEKAERENQDDPNEFDPSTTINFEHDGKKYIYDMEMAEAEKKYHEKAESEMYKKMALGFAVGGVIPDDGVSRGKGILEQIEESSAVKTYSKLTEETLKTMMDSLGVPAGNEFMVMTGRAGRRDLAVAMREEGRKLEIRKKMEGDYLQILMEYDISDEDKKDMLSNIRKEFYYVFGEHLTVKDADYTTHKELLSFKELRERGYLAPHLHFNYIGHDAFNDVVLDKESTPVVPNLGDSPAGGGLLEWGSKSLKWAMES
jgi:hypothetical protein